MSDHPHLTTHMLLALVLADLTEGWMSAAWFLVSVALIVAYWWRRWRDRKDRR